MKKIKYSEAVWYYCKSLAEDICRSDTKMDEMCICDEVAEQLFCEAVWE